MWRGGLKPKLLRPLESKNEGKKMKRDKKCPFALCSVSNQWRSRGREKLMSNNKAPSSTQEGMRHTTLQP